MAQPQASDELHLPPLLARTYAVCVLCIVTASVFFLTGVAPLPVLLYFPISRRFGFAPSPTELSMDFYGRSLLAILAGVAAALSTYALLMSMSMSRLKRSAPEGAPRRKPLLLLTGYAATALLLAASLFAYQLSIRVPTPLPFPENPNHGAAASSAAP